MYAGFGKGCLREVRLAGRFVESTDLAEFGAGIFILLRIIIAGDPIGSDISGHSELGLFLLDDEIIEVSLLREDITEAQTIVVEAELDLYIAIFGGLFESDEHLVVAIVNASFFSPYCLPPAVMYIPLAAGHDETVHQAVHFFVGVVFRTEIIKIRTSFLAADSEPEERRTDNGIALMNEPIDRPSVLYVKVRSEVQRRGLDFLNGV